jgi:hypothetical protein
MKCLLPTSVSLVLAMLMHGNVRGQGPNAAPPEMKALERLVGTWKVETNVKVPEEIRSTNIVAKRELVLGGRFVQETGGFDDEGKATFGIVGGGIYGPLVGACASKGKLKGLVLGYHFTLLAVSVGLAAAGGYAYLVGQPNGIWLPLVLVGLLGGILFGGLAPGVLKRYRDAELAQEQTQDT